MPFSPSLPLWKIPKTVSWQDTPNPFPLLLLLYNLLENPGQLCMSRKKIKEIVIPNNSEYRFSWGWNFRTIVRYEFRRLKLGLCIKTTIGNIQHMSVTYRSLSKYFAFSVFSSYPWGCLQSLHLRQFKHIFLIFPQLRPMHCNAVSVWKFATGNESFLEITVYFCDNRFLRQQIAISHVSIYMYFSMTCTKGIEFCNF